MEIEIRFPLSSLRIIMFIIFIMLLFVLHCVRFFQPHFFHEKRLCAANHGKIVTSFFPNELWKSLQNIRHSLAIFHHQKCFGYTEFVRTAREKKAVVGTKNEDKWSAQMQSLLCKHGKEGELSLITYDKWATLFSTYFPNLNLRLNPSPQKNSTLF